MGSVNTAASPAAARGGVPIITNKNMAANVTTADGQVATSTPVANTPRSDSHVKVEVNTVDVRIADGDAQRTTSEAYFSGDGGTTARNIADIVAGDTLFWNGSVANYELAAPDRISFFYDT